MKALLIFVLGAVIPHVNIPNKLSISVEAGSYSRENCIVSADVSSLNLDENSSVKLYEKTANKETAVPCQLMWKKNKASQLYWILDGKTAAGATRTFVARKIRKASSSVLPMSVENTEGILILKKTGKNILQYNYAHVNPPDGVDPSYGRSGFIHPVYSPNGHILTRIQPKDHYHHYGIWNPWTRVEYEGQIYDLWNLGDKQGTVKAQNVIKTYQGDIFAGFKAKLGHYIFTAGNEQVIMNETWHVQAWNIADGFLWDFESQLTPSTQQGVLLKEYRYGGFTWRAAEEWTDNNTEMYTSEGRTRAEIDGSRARWIYTTGDTKAGRSGMLIMGHPTNFNFPEPLRIWDQRANGGRGDIFVNFAPTKNRDWQLAFQRTYSLRYRLFTYEGEMTREKADQLWHDFAYPPVVQDNIGKRQ